MILQIEDQEKYKIAESDSVETLEEAKELMKGKEYDSFVIDGSFPLNKGDEPDINTQAAVEFIQIKNPEAKIIVWANSIRAQKYAEDNNILCFSKNQKEEEHVEKMKKYNLKEYAQVKTKEEIIEKLK